MRVVRRIVVALLALIGTFTLLAAAGAAFAVWRLKLEPQALPDRIVLTADWRSSLGETAGPPDLLNLRFRPSPTVTDTVLALDAAAKDPRVRGLVVRLAETEHGFAVAQELREAVLRFRAAGKFAIAEADTFGELGSGNEGYYIATAFELIALQPGGIVGLTGIAVQIPLARDLLASLGIRMEVLRRAEFKSAFESLTDSELSGPNREQLDALLDSLNGQLVSGIAEQRKLTPEQVQALIDRGPLSADEAQQAKLVDMLYYHDQTMTSALGRVQGQAVDLETYVADGMPSVGQPAARIALVRAAGLVRRGEGALGTEIAADDLVETLDDIAQDREIAAVLLRLDTGGGSAVASESIRRALVELRAARKPVIVSMGNSAASGGYWIAMGADRIIAQPATLTGSIGVIGGKPVLEEAWRKLGVNWATITRGAHAADWSINEPFSDSARARVDALIGWLYDRFTSLVAEARGLPQARVEQLARGRVWSGEDAAQLGLVDTLGGLDEALAAVRQSLKLPADAPLAIDVRPFETNPLRAFLRSLSPIGAHIRALLAPDGLLAAIAPPFSAR